MPCDHCELRPEAKRREVPVGFGGPGKQSGGLFSAKGGRQPRAPALRAKHKEPSETTEKVKKSKRYQKEIREKVEYI